MVRFVIKGGRMKDYQEYYIQGSDHYLIPKEEFEELLNRIDKAIEYIDKQIPNILCIHDEEILDDLLKILKGEEDE